MPIHDDQYAVDDFESKQDGDAINSLEKILNRKSSALRFPDHYEEQFQQSFAKTWAKQIRLALIVGTTIFWLSYFFDLYLQPNLKYSVVMYLGIVGPGAILFLATFLPNYFDQNQQSIIFVLALLLGLLSLAISHHMPDEYQAFYLSAMLLSQIYALAFCRLQFTYAVWLGVLNVLSLNIFLLLDPSNSLVTYLGYNFINICGFMLLLSNNYFMERSERQDFLRSLMINLEKHQMRRINLHLKNLATSDALTGVANFRHFENMLQNEWARAMRYRYPIALLMVDFDNFKKYNDHYGHQVGDEALQMIAKTLDSFARRPGDLAIRYGGDEFALLLIGAGIIDALSIANSCREKIEHTEIISKLTSNISHVTVTIGVASLTPERDDEPSKLLKFADDALLAAKAAGKNRVHSMENKVVNTNYSEPFQNL